MPVNDANHGLYAFLATLLAIVVLVGMGCLMAISGRPVEAVGIRGAVTGLIGLIGTFKPRTQGVSNQTAQSLVDKLPPETQPADTA